MSSPYKKSRLNLPDRPKAPAAAPEPVDPRESSRSRRRLFVMVGLTALIAIVVATLYYFNFLPHPSYSNADFGIETYQSTYDYDGDGVDDQTDILLSARAYLATHPSYKSAYYASGYPDDGYGVCTDVVAFALYGAGYNLMELVDADIRAYPEAYDIETPDKNIDFRRVDNLYVYLNRHAEPLTTDRRDLAAWQGGDIVVFQDHIGIVADQRNRNGLPFLIHHYSPLQATYEEDVLGRFNQDYIIGHYRIHPPTTE